MRNSNLGTVRLQEGGKPERGHPGSLEVGGTGREHRREEILGVFHLLIVDSWRQTQKETRTQTFTQTNFCILNLSVINQRILKKPHSGIDLSTSMESYPEKYTNNWADWIVVPKLVRMRILFWSDAKITDFNFLVWRSRAGCSGRSLAGRVAQVWTRTIFTASHGLGFG